MVHLIGANLSEPHTSGNLVFWFVCKELRRKTGLQHTTTVWYGGCTNKHDKLTDASIQVLSTVVHVTVNKELSLLMLHIWYGCSCHGE